MKKSLLHACNTIGCLLLPKLTLCRVWIWIIIFSLCISIFKTTKEAWPVAKKQHNWKWMYHYFKHTFISCMDWYLIAFATRIMVHSKNPKIKCLAKAKHTNTHTWRERKTRTHTSAEHKWLTVIRAAYASTLHFRTTEAVNVYRKSSQLFCFLLFSTLTGSSQRNRSHSYSVYFCQCYHIVINQKYSNLTQRNTTHQQQHQVYYSASFIEHWHCVFFLFPHRRMHTD